MISDQIMCVAMSTSHSVAHAKSSGHFRIFFESQVRISKSISSTRAQEVWVPLDDLCDIIHNTSVVTELQGEWNYPLPFLSKLRSALSDLRSSNATVQLFKGPFQRQTCQWNGIISHHPNMLKKQQIFWTVRT